MSNVNDFVIENSVLIDYVGPGGELVFPEGVTSIKRIFNNLFYKKDSIHSITIPQSMTCIDSNIFQDFKNLKTVNLHEGIKSIGEYAFYNCPALVDINIPEGIEHIGEAAFSGCESLQNEDGFVIVENVLFDYYGTVEMLTLPSVEIIGCSAFSHNMQIKKVVIPESVMKIERGAFQYCSNLESVVLPDNGLYIDESAFSNCQSLKEEGGFSIVKNRLYGYYGQDRKIIIPENVNYINDYVFSSMLNIEEVVFPNHTVDIGSGAFYGCSNLKCITMTTDTLTVSAKKNKIFGQTGKTIELNLIEEDGTSRRVIGAFRKDYYAQKWAYEEDYLVPLTANDISNYDRMIAAGEFEGFKPNEQGRLKAMILRLMEKEHPVAAEYREIFAEFLGSKFSKALKMAEEDQAPAYIRAVIEIGAVTDANRKKITKALEKSSMEEIKQIAEQIDDITASVHAAAPEEDLTCNVEKKFLDQLKAINAKAILLKAGIENIPDVLLANSNETAPKEYLQLILAEYLSQYKKSYYVFSELADEAAKLLDRKSLEQTVVMLYKNVPSESIQLTFLPVVFRYANGEFINEVYRKYAGMKWMVERIKNCLLLSDTREAMILAEKNKLLDRYAAVRRTNSDYIRYTSLYDFGFDSTGKKIYNLGSTEVEVTVNQNLTFSLYDYTAGKTVKSIPKRNTDPELYAAASSDFSEMKKSLKKAVRAFVGRLFQMYLDGTSIAAEQWASVFFENPVLRQTASLLVWSQGGKTFTLSDCAAIDSKGQPYILSAENVFVAHPVEMSAEEIVTWQKYFIANNLKQPFEQIWEPAVDFDTVTEDRYNGVLIPVYRFKGQEKHGITFKFDMWGSYLEIYMNDCWLEYDSSATVAGTDLNLQGNLLLGKFRAKKSRAANHIIALLDKWSIYNRILKDDTFVIQMLHNATLAQVSDYLRVAAENNSTNVTAALLDYKNRIFEDFNPMDEFILNL